MKARDARKGAIIVVHAVPVRVTQREKWNSRRVKVHFEDCGSGLPERQFGAEVLSIREKMYDLDDELEVAPAAPPSRG